MCYIPHAFLHTFALLTSSRSTQGADQVISELCRDAKTVQPHPTPLEGEIEYCSNSAELTTEQTYTLSGDSAVYMNEFPMTITAGTEKLDASAAATPTGSGARSTGPAASQAASPSGAVRPSGSAGTSGSPTEVSTAGAPMMTLAPLAGLGAAAAAFFL